MWKQQTLGWNNIQLFHLRLNKTEWSCRGLPAWDLIWSLNLCFKSVLWSSMGQWCVSLELEAGRSLFSHCLPRTDSWALIYSLVSWAPPRLPPCQPCPLTRSHNQLTLIGAEAHIPGLPLPSALGWRLGGSVGRVRCTPMPSMARARLYSSQPRADSTVVNSAGNSAGASQPLPSQVLEFLSMKVKISWGSHIYCGLGQQTLKEGSLTSPPPARLLLYHLHWVPHII